MQSKKKSVNLNWTGLNTKEAEFEFDSFISWSMMKDTTDGFFAAENTPEFIALQWRQVNCRIALINVSTEFQLEYPM